MMKKSILLILVLQLLLTACQSVPDSTKDPTVSAPSSGISTTPTSPTPQPTTPSVTASEGFSFIYKGSGYYVLPGWAPIKGQRDHLYWVVEETKEYFALCEEPVIYHLTTDTHVYYIKKAEPTNLYAITIGNFTDHQLLQETPLPVIKDGLAFRYYDSNRVVLMPDWKYTEGKPEHLYWVVKGTKEVFLICDEPVVDHVIIDTHVYFVKASEPTKLYRTPIGDFSAHEMVYVCANGSISSLTCDTFTIREELILQFVADNKKFMVLDLKTGEEHCIMEQFYIRSALFEDGCTDTWEEQRELVFYGMPTEGAKNTGYFYYLDTGEIEEIFECAD